MSLERTTTGDEAQEDRNSLVWWEEVSSKRWKGRCDHNYLFLWHEYCVLKKVTYIPCKQSFKDCLHWENDKHYCNTILILFSFIFVSPLYRNRLKFVFVQKCVVEISGYRRRNLLSTTRMLFVSVNIISVLKTNIILYLQNIYVVLSRKIWVPYLWSSWY